MPPRWLGPNPPPPGRPLDDVWDAFRETVGDHGDRIRHEMAHPVQTNEVGRSAVLAGGFLTLFRRHALPLRILEIGSSAGLNLRWERYRYEDRGMVWGDAA